MSKLVENLRNIFKIEELRDRILFTIALLAVVRVGAHITLPGVDASLLAEVIRSQSQNSLFALYDLFAGGAFQNAAVFALGIMPYISAAIILQLLGAVVPYFRKLQQEGEEGRRKLEQYARQGTVLVAALQAWGVSIRLMNMTTPGGLPIVPEAVKGIGFVISTVFILTAGTIFIMWLGEQITERGIGNGISLIIFVGIIARFPNALLEEFQLIKTGSRSIIEELLIITGMVLVVALVIFVTTGTRRIPVQYAKRVVGRRVYGGVTQYIPIRVNAAGVMPIIFAQSVMFLPSTIITFFPQSEALQEFAANFNYTSFWYNFIYALLVIFFTYLYTAIVFNPQDIADTMRKQGGFIPGIRPGKNTADFIDNILTKITLPGAIFLAIIAILPGFMIRLGVSPTMASFFGGTSLLIVVGVALDTLQQIETYLLMRHYDGFMKTGRIKSRVGY
jgi:preprotein translocase subunit SecY